MLTYSFTNLKNESLYMHLYQCIRQDIVDCAAALLRKEG